MSVMNGDMGSRVIDEIAIIKELEILKGSEIRKENNKKIVKECSGYDLKVMSGSEIGELRVKIEGVLRDEKLGVIRNVEIRKLREEVKGVMWRYYCENKFELNEGIGDFREEIIVELMKGGDVKKVFEFFGRGGLARIA